jgi:hypothetical protein
MERKEEKRNYIQPELVGFPVHMGSLFTTGERVVKEYSYNNLMNISASEKTK